MTIDIHGIPSDRMLRARVAKRMAAALAPLRVRPVAARVAFVDENGPKGGVAIRCALTVQLPYRPTVRVEHVGETPRVAFDQSFAALERQLARHRERQRERSRRPKKYFVAKSLLTAVGASASGK